MNRCIIPPPNRGYTLTIQKSHITSPHPDIGKNGESLYQNIGHPYMLGIREVVPVAVLKTLLDLLRLLKQSHFVCSSLIPRLCLISTLMSQGGEMP